MKRKLGAVYGVEGEYYVEGDENNIIDYNNPPSTQPSLWCQWVPVERDGEHYIEWDGSEKFYNYVDWIVYIIDKILTPRGYSLTGDVKWQGERGSDFGLISINENTVTVSKGKVTYDQEEVKYSAKPLL